MREERAKAISVALARQIIIKPGATLCAACVDVLRVTGVGLTLMTRHHTGPMCASNELTRQLEELQYSLGEGPCHDAFRSGLSSGSDDLRAKTDKKWPNYSPSALEAGACAVFAFPLGHGDGRIGAMTIYRDTPGCLTAEQSDDSVMLADVLTEAILSVQAEEEPDVLATSLIDDASHRAEVHQASGVVAIQLGIGTNEALARIRAYAYSCARPLGDVAADIVDRRIHLHDDRGLNATE